MKALQYRVWILAKMNSCECIQICVVAKIKSHKKRSVLQHTLKLQISKCKEFEFYGEFQFLN